MRSPSSSELGFKPRTSVLRRCSLCTRDPTLLVCNRGLMTVFRVVETKGLLMTSRRSEAQLLETALKRIVGKMCRCFMKVFQSGWFTALQRVERCIVGRRCGLAGRESESRGTGGNRSELLL